MNTGLCTIAFRDRPFEAVLVLAVAAGFDGVEPWGKADHTPEPFDADVIRKYSDAVKERGLEVAQYGSYANPTDELFDQQMADAIAISEIYETDKIRVWVGSCGSADADDAQWAKAIEGFATFCDCAAEKGMSLVSGLSPSGVRATPITWAWTSPLAVVVGPLSSPSRLPRPR